MRCVLCVLIYIDMSFHRNTFNKYFCSEGSVVILYNIQVHSACCAMYVWWIKHYEAIEISLKKTLMEQVMNCVLLKATATMSATTSILPKYTTHYLNCEREICGDRDKRLRAQSSRVFQQRNCCLSQSTIFSCFTCKIMRKIEFHGNFFH